LAAALDWLEEPRHSKRRCSKGFLKNWVAKADADRKAREQAPPHPPAPLAAQQGPRPQPSRERPRPAAGAREADGVAFELTPMRPADFSRFVAERRKLTNEQRMAQWRGGAK
jgi:hypothetical protein